MSGPRARTRAGQRIRQANVGMPVRPLLLPAFSGFGVRLQKLRPADLPLLCKYRNADDVLRYMEDGREVPLPVLEFWFRKAEASGRTFPFLAFFEEEPIAYVDVRNCDYARSCCEDGIFLFDSRRLGTGLGSRIWLCREQVLRALAIRDVFSSIRPENLRSIHFFEKMGAKSIGRAKGLLLYRQDQEARLAALRRAAARLDLSQEYERVYGTP